ncbi:hypothetical protein C8Q77DRAFT_297749 [Trametes polyzona]|nr:hypothetical protein C8Q77DRAFT_297749 [Trametes polyzona]
MLDIALDVWDVVSGALGILIAAVPFLVFRIYKRLPSTKLPTLLTLLHEVQRDYAIALQEGLLTNESERTRHKLAVVAATVQVEHLRAQIYAESSWSMNIRNWWRGLSRRMSYVEQAMKETRMTLADNDSRERARRASMGAFHTFHFCLTEQEDTSTSALPSVHPTGRSSSSGHQSNWKPSHATVPQCTHIDDAPISAVRDTADPSRAIAHCDAPLAVPTAPLAALPGSAHLLISNVDMRMLLSLALTHPLVSRDDGDGERQATLRWDLLRLGKDLDDVLAGDSETATKVADGLDGGMAATLACVVRRIYGAQLDIGCVDPESLEPPHP